jgi:hypothetical protein
MVKFQFVRIAVASSLALAAAAALASSDYLLELDGIDGASTTKSPPQSIEVTSFSWGASNPSSVGAGSGGGAGKVNVQDLSVTSNVKTAREASSGMATGKRAPVAADVSSDGPADVAAASPKVGDVATLTLNVRESPSKASTGGTGKACAPGKHFADAVLTAQGKRYQMQDVMVTSCTVQGSTRTMQLTGHVTLIK